ncbi:MAG: EamA family transporter [Desulfobacterales bacterium]|nr:EamA family transporter [Desulfobacterales bacterium]MBS3755293.1 EamA family transporter [Desulfobacterales bacterium]
MITSRVQRQAHGRIPLQLKGVFMTLLGAFCFSLVPIWVRAIEAYTPVSIVFYRALIGICPLLFWTMRSPQMRARASVTRLDWKYRLVLLGVGLSMCGTASTYYLAIMNTSVAKAVLLHYTAPIYVAIISPVLLKEKNAPLTWFAVGAGLLGTALITDPATLFTADPDEIIGIISAAVSGLCLSGVFLFGRFLAGHLPSQVRTLWGCVIVAVLLLPWGLQVPAGYFWQNLPWLCLLGTVSLALPYTLFFKGQNYISAQAASLISLFEPVCGIGIGFLFFAEKLTLTGSLGAAIVLFSIYIASRR